MTPLMQQTQPIQTLLTQSIGETKVKTFFSYYGIFKDGVMFALCKQGKFYLRISPRLCQQYSWTTELTRLEDSQSGIYDKHYYHIPDHLFEVLTTSPELLTETIREIAEAKQQQLAARKKLIRSLPNLSLRIERLLRRLGIYTIEDLHARGAVAIFVELIRRGIDADTSLLFKLYGAIHHQYAYTLSMKTRLSILAELNHALYEAGLRQRF